MTCSEFRRAFHPGARDAEALTHLRSCADCLEFAVALDPDCLFVSLGGEELVPPGGVDEFVARVMGEIRIRGTEQKVASIRGGRTRYWWSLAAAIAIATFSAVLVFRPAMTPETVPSAALVASVAADRAIAQTIVPVVEHYEADDATIIEIPTQSDDDIRVVMIFDESLPVDL